jgi:hypothetical protein
VERIVEDCTEVCERDSMLAHISFGLVRITFKEPPSFPFLDCIHDDPSSMSCQYAEKSIAALTNGDILFRDVHLFVQTLLNLFGRGSVEK